MKILQRVRFWFTHLPVIWRGKIPEGEVTLEVRQWLPWLLALGLLGWYIAAPSPTVITCLVVVIGVCGIAFGWAMHQARWVRGLRQLRSSVMQVGDELEELITLDNPTFLPVLWAEFYDRSDIPGYTVSSVRAGWVKSIVSWQAHVLCSRRGVFQLGPWELCFGDLFGLFLVRQVYMHKHDVLVYPPLANLPPHIFPRGGSMGEQRTLRLPLAAETIHAMSVRHFVPGDPLRHVHWKTSARRDQTYVKLFDPEAASRIWLIPDFDAAVHLGGNDVRSSEEMMVIITATLASRFLREGLAVGLLAGSEANPMVQPQRGKVHLWKVLRALAPLHARPGWTLRRTLEMARPLMTPRDLPVVITPSLNPDWLPRLRDLARGGLGRPAEVVLLDPASFGAYPSGRPFLEMLSAQAIHGQLIRKEEVQAIEQSYGQTTRWEFIGLGTGRAIARRAPRRLAQSPALNKGEILG